MDLKALPDCPKCDWKLALTNITQAGEVKTALGESEETLTFRCQNPKCNYWRSEAYPDEVIERGASVMVQLRELSSISKVKLLKVVSEGEILREVSP